MLGGGRGVVYFQRKKEKKGGAIGWSSANERAAHGEKSKTNRPSNENEKKTRLGKIDHREDRTQGQNCAPRIFKPVSRRSGGTSCRGPHGREKSGKCVRKEVFRLRLGNKGKLEKGRKGVHKRFLLQKKQGGPKGKRGKHQILRGRGTMSKNVKEPVGNPLFRRLSNQPQKRQLENVGYGFSVRGSRAGKEEKVKVL